MAIRLGAEDLRSLGFASIGGAYTKIGTPFTHAIRIIYILNNTDAGILISDNGTRDIVFIASGSFLLLDVTTNEDETQGLFIHVGEQLWIKEATVAPTIGTVYISAFYGVI